MASALRPAADCRFDLASLGECMVRLSPPGHGRIELARSFEVWVGGAEYNVAYALARFGLRTAWIGGLVDNPVARIIAQHARAAGVDLSRAVTRRYDGVGRDARIGLNFTEVGTGIRPSVSIYDRGYSATSGMGPGSVDWNSLFGKDGVRWFHTGGVMASLSDSCAALVRESVEEARRAGTFISYDLNFRSKLWSSEQAVRATRPLVPAVDCLIGNEEDFQKALGYGVEGGRDDLRGLDVEAYQRMVRRVAGDFPDLKLIGTTLREVLSGDVNHWSAILYVAAEDRFVRGPRFGNLQIEDCVGGGDGFASGLIFGLLTGESVDGAVRLGTAHGALVQTTRGDTSQVTLAELKHAAAGGSARIQR